MNLNEFFHDVAKSFDLEFENFAKQIEHNGEAGRSREFALSALLKKYLPKRAAVDTGFVIDATGGCSKQIDIIIYDQTVGTMFEVNGIKFFPCETVLAVGEVKTRIDNSATLDDALDKIKSVKSLDRLNRGNNRLSTGSGITSSNIQDFMPVLNHKDQIFGFIFTGHCMTEANITKQLRTFMNNNSRILWPNLFCSYKQFLISYYSSGRLTSSAMDAQQLYITNGSEMEENNLVLLFYAILSTFIESAHIAFPQLFHYLDIPASSIHLSNLKE